MDCAVSNRDGRKNRSSWELVVLDRGSVEDRDKISQKADTPETNHGSDASCKAMWCHG